VKEYLREIVERSAPRDAVNIMREYLQARILESLQEGGAWASMAFRGGTSLRFLYLLPRFSEELHFALETPSSEFDFLGLIASARTRFEKEGYRTQAKASTRTVVNKAFIRFPGLEHELGLSDRAEKTLSVKIEVDTRPPTGAGLEVTTVRRHATLRLSHHDKSSLLAGKVAALLCRGWLKGRDVYDLVWYLSDPTWPEPNETLLTNALRQSGPAYPPAEVEGWKSALVRRLGEAPWDGVKADVERFLERPTEVWMVEREAVLGVMAQRGWGE
jgi:predicted nucleotidyltransferase component of viral defense system